MLDVVMPGLNGPALHQRLLSVRPEIKVMFMPGYDRERLRALPPAPFLPKPFLPRALVERVNSILGNENARALLDDENGASA